MVVHLVLGVATVLAIALAPVALLAAVSGLPATPALLRRTATRLRLVPPAPVAPDGPPLEKLAADLRRLRPAVDSPRRGISMAKHLAVVGVYDARLVSTAHALDIPTALAELPAGFEREAERLRLEHALESAGLRWELEAS